MEINALKAAFEDKIINKPEHMSDDDIRKQHLSYIDYHNHNRPDSVLNIPIEEMSELTQHLIKILRGKETKDNIGLLEELADVQICLDNLKIYFGINDDDFKYMMDIKFERAARNIIKNDA